MTIKTNTNPVRKTLGLTGITINAMALTAPGAFLWLALSGAGVCQL